MQIAISFVFLSIILTAQALTLSPEQKAKVKQYHATCVTDTKVNPEVVKKARRGQFLEDAALKEYVFCFLKKANLVNNKGTLNEDVLMAKLPPDTNMLAAKVITELCKSQRGVNAADTAFQLYKCYYEATPQHVSLI